MTFERARLFVAATVTIVVFVAGWVLVPPDVGADIVDAVQSSASAANR